MSDTFDWNEIAQAKKMAKTSDHSLCGNVIAEYRDNIIVVEFGAKLHGYDPKISGRELRWKRYLP